MMGGCKETHIGFCGELQLQRETMFSNYNDPCVSLSDISGLVGNHDGPGTVILRTLEPQ